MIFISYKGQQGQKMYSGPKAKKMTADYLVRTMQMQGSKAEDYTIVDQDTNQEMTGAKFLQVNADLLEAPINLPKSNDDMSFVSGLYKQDKTGNKYQQRLPAEPMQQIPGLNLSHELMRGPGGELTLYHSVDPYEDPVDFKDKVLNFLNKTAIDPRVQRKPLGMVRFTPFKDGYEISNMAVDPDQRRKGLAQKLVTAMAKYLKKPVYSGKQMSADGKAFMQSMFKSAEQQGYRVVGYDQTQNKEFALDNVDDLFTEPSGDPRKDLRNTKLIKIIPENYVDPKLIIEHILTEAEEIQGSPQLFANYIFDLADEQRQLGKVSDPADKLRQFLKVIDELESSKIDRKQITPIQFVGRAVDRFKQEQRDNIIAQTMKKIRSQDVKTLNNFMQTNGYAKKLRIKDVSVDLTMPPKYGKNTVSISGTLKEQLYSEEQIREVLDTYPTLKDVANMIYRHSQNRELALEFFHMDWEHDYDAQSILMRSMNIDPYQIDIDTANKFMQKHNLPFKIVRMFDMGHELYFELA